jgi:gamma-glutamyltranspeptidase/glutathione hydrolase
MFHKILSKQKRRIQMKKFIFSIIGCASITAVLLFTSVFTGCKSNSTTDYVPTYAAPRVNAPLVVSFHQQAIDAGLRILNAGGNAFDAFVAVVVVENVVSSGYVTLAGLLSALIYHAETNEIIYLDGGFNSVLDPDGEYNPANPILGKMVVVPGLIAGLEAISSRYGRLSFAEVLQPSIELARDGFVIDDLYAWHIELYAEKLQRTEYGRRTFFPGGTALQAGDILRQPELAEFLANLAEQGASYMYTGEWAAQCVETVRSEGGLMTLEDLASYKPTWGEPWRMSYRGYDICASSGRSMFALWSLLALKTLEHTSIQPLGHFSASADALEIVVRVARAVEEEYWIYDYRYLDNRDLVNSRLTSSYTDSIWARVEGALPTVYRTPPLRHHTLSLIVADTDGNVVSGKHSINSNMYGSGLFVQGIPLTGSGELTERRTGPGQRRTQGAPSFLVFKNGPLTYACGTVGSSNPHTAFQFLVNLMDYGLHADQAAALPRFGGFSYDEAGAMDYSKNDLDERVSQEIVAVLEMRGLYFKRQRRVGLGCIAEFHADGNTTSRWGR